MELVNLESKNYPGDPTRYFHFERFLDDSSKKNWILIPGVVDFSRLQKKRNEKYVYLEFEEPNRFCSNDPLFNRIGYEDSLDRILTICPYTADWLNKLHGDKKRTVVFFPFNETYTPKAVPKEYDVIYTGNILSDSLEKLAEIIGKYNYRLVSNSPHPLVTNQGVSYRQKLKLIASSKITVVHNLLYLSKEHVKNLYEVSGWKDNEAFSFVPKNRLSLSASRAETIVPQMKSRVFEAAFSKSLILCRKDPFNLIERYFEPEKDFIYYEPEALGSTLDSILNNYADYQAVVERAYKKATSFYTTEVFFDKYLRQLND